MMKGINGTLDYKTIKKLHANLIRTGTVTQQKGADRPKTVTTEEAKAAAAEAFQRSPKKSIRQYQRESGISFLKVNEPAKIKQVEDDWVYEYPYEQKRANTAQSLAFAERRIEAVGGNRDAT
ncbi:hypothetical protein ANN_17053 [Periplaneta americana]|uniref:Uncharacterized protein n=1 Tax=Periplaneta americana TaxID=6978 RepID=A0ABQ8ST54_PERAM|nr:hypothetical protein ANN_17053 [Periplaneta americana]